MNNDGVRLAGAHRNPEVVAVDDGSQLPARQGVLAGLVQGVPDGAGLKKTAESWPWRSPPPALQAANEITHLRFLADAHDSHGGRSGPAPTADTGRALVSSSPVDGALKQAADGQPVEDDVGAGHHHQPGTHRLNVRKDFAQGTNHGAFEKCHSQGQQHYDKSHSQGVE